MPVLAAATGMVARVVPLATRPESGVQVLERRTHVPVALDTAFAFFADAANLERLTPPWLHFDVVTPMPVEMREGLELDYRLSLRGVPMPWRSRIDVWEPGQRFVDRQLIGPYRWWHHEHVFREVDGGTDVVDRVEYVVPFAIATRRWVRRDVERIFDFRAVALHEALADVGHRRSRM